MDLNLLSAVGAVDASSVGQYLLDGAINAGKAIFHNLLPIVVSVVIPLVTKRYFTIMAKQEKMLDQAHEQKELAGKHDYFYNLKKEFFEHAVKVVQEVEQVYVSSFKGKDFNKESQDIAYQKARDTLLSNFSQAEKDALAAGSRDLEKLTETAIESAVASSTEHKELPKVLEYKPEVK